MVVIARTMRLHNFISLAAVHSESTHLYTTLHGVTTSPHLSRCLVAGSTRSCLAALAPVPLILSCARVLVESPERGICSTPPIMVRAVFCRQHAGIGFVLRPERELVVVIRVPIHRLGSGCRRMHQNPESMPVGVLPHPVWVEP